MWYKIILKIIIGNSLAVQGWELSALTARAPSSTPGWGAKIPQARGRGKNIYIFYYFRKRIGGGEEEKKRLKIGKPMWQKFTIFCDRRGKVKYQLYIINMEETAM